MLCQKLLWAVFLAVTCINALPDLAKLGRSLENEIYERELSELGLTRREDHPSPESVRQEVDYTMARLARRTLSKAEKSCRDLRVGCSTDHQCQSSSNGKCKSCNLKTRKCSMKKKKRKDKTPSKSSAVKGSLGTPLYDEPEEVDLGDPSGDPLDQVDKSAPNPEPKNKKPEDDLVDE